MTEKRIQAAALRTLCGGVSDMWLWRRLCNDPTFPRPVYIGGRRFWKEAEVISWLDAQPGADRGAA
jgi:predicted DNA-binding transcriptional regulator AlpA